MSSRAPSAVHPREVARHFERFLGLAAVEPPQRLPSAAETAVWRVAARARTYVVKIFPADWLEAVHTEVELFDYLRERVVRTPDPLTGSNGERVGRLGAGWRDVLGAPRHPFMVMLFEDGRAVTPASVTREELFLIARHIARMHQALQQYSRRDRIRRTARWGSHLGRFDDFLASPNARSFAPREFARLRELDRAMEQRAVTAVAAAAVETVLHGDLGLHHVRLPESAAKADAMPFLFDFSDFSRGPVVTDLATMLSQLYCAGAVDIARWEQLRTWLLEGYAEAFPLGPDERRALEDALIERLLIEVRYFTRVSLNEGRAISPEGIRKRYRLAAHLFGSDWEAGRSAARHEARAPAPLRAASR